MVLYYPEDDTPLLMGAVVKKVAPLGLEDSDDKASLKQDAFRLINAWDVDAKVDYISNLLKTSKSSFKVPSRTAIRQLIDKEYVEFTNSHGRFEMMTVSKARLGILNEVNCFEYVGLCTTEWLVKTFPEALTPLTYRLMSESEEYVEIGMAVVKTYGAHRVTEELIKADGFNWYALWDGTYETYQMKDGEEFIYYQTGD